MMSTHEHTLISYRIARGLLRLRPEVDAATVLTAVIFHDVGWKMIPEEKLTASIGPKAKYPELQRVHEEEGVKIARPLLEKLAVPGANIAQVLAIIDGHDTRKQAISDEDAVMKDADKLWRFTGHGVRTVSGWFEMTTKDCVAMLESYVLPQLLTDAGRTMAEALLAEGEADAWLKDALELEMAE
jgi:hypothetical protein